MKNYTVSGNHAGNAIATPQALDLRKPSAEDCQIDMFALLGPEARFPTGVKALDLRSWLNRGIDEWVFTAGYCLKALLLSGSATASVRNYSSHLPYLFEFLTQSNQQSAPTSARTPGDLSPLHIQQFNAWLHRKEKSGHWSATTTRNIHKAVKAVLVRMFTLGFIQGEPSRFFIRGAVTWRVGESRQTSLSDAEQERLAKAIKSDLVGIHHGRLALTQGAIQGLRLLLVAHRQGLNPTPLLEMRRDALAPGFLPGTIRMLTVKHRNKSVRSSLGRSAHRHFERAQSDEQEEDQSLVFDLSEGAVIQQAIASTNDLVEEAPAALRQRIWLYRSDHGNGVQAEGCVTSLDRSSLTTAIDGVVRRHRLLADDGRPMRVNLSRLRKSRFDRALRVADGDLVVTANLLNNTPRIAGQHYPSMNAARKAESAGFMNDGYTALMRSKPQHERASEIQPALVDPFTDNTSGTRTLPSPTPVSGCRDSINGEHAPRDGRSHCDRYVMCLFCSSFAIVGTVDELWRLFSFQQFAQTELLYLDESLGQERTDDRLLEDLRDRYRLAIPYIDDFTRRHFAGSRLARARAKTADGLHPYWLHQMHMSRRVRQKGLNPEADASRDHGHSVEGSHRG